MRYHFKHLTRFNYQRPIKETVMELRMHPLTDGLQQCLSLIIDLNPPARMFRYEDHLGNIVHHFDIPEDHQALSIDVSGEVEVQTPPPLPDKLGPDAWDSLDRLLQAEDFSEMLSYGQLAQPTEAATAFAASIECTRRDDPLSVVRHINNRLHEDFKYSPESTCIDTPLDQVLETRQGVCQDFAHLMVVLVRGLGIPCRYISGYLHSGDGTAPQASHAWVEAFLPDLGWVGFDPTAGKAADEKYIRTAVGRDYADVPPTKGVFKGEALSELQVGVMVSPVEGLARDVPIGWRSYETGRTVLSGASWPFAGQ